MSGGDPIRRARFVLSKEEIPRAVAWIASEATALGVTERQSFGAQLCAEELLVNAVNHGRRPRLSVHMALEALPDRLRLTLQDDGVAFDLAAAPERTHDDSLEDAQPGGWGTALIRRFADYVACGRESDNNIVALDFLRASHD